MEFSPENNENIVEHFLIETQTLSQLNHEFMFPIDFFFLFFSFFVRIDCCPNYCGVEKLMECEGERGVVCGNDQI